ncbi:MAG: energy-coupling factor transporter transmembrane protein EcfT [Clostridiales bacterium]|nr:energy-coupling factor transporter transmembrane protein EcfT [Clostridiales bacterium]
MKEYHPIISFTYFVLVILFSMFFMHPIFLFISFLSSIVYLLKLKGKKGLKLILGLFIIMVLIVLINPFMSHEGNTILLYINGRALTLEAIVYGAMSSIMLATVIIWFSCYNEIMTSDKFIFLFGRIIPKTSLIFSMVLRFVPRFKVQLKNITNGQKAIGKSVSNGNIIDKALHGINIISVLVTWALENAIDTADSMKARGYGLKGRSNFSIFKFHKRDFLSLCILISLGLIIIVGTINGANYILYYPVISMNTINLFSIIIYFAYFILCIFPIILDVMEWYKWI